MAPLPAHGPRRLATDAGIRCLGVLLAGAGGGAGYGLTHWALRGALPFLFATIAFAGLSFGGLLTALGHHVFDQVEVSPRWRSVTPASSKARMQGAGASVRSGEISDLT